MPRETVTAMVGPYEVQVGWTKDRADLQVAVTVEEGRSMFWNLINPETMGLIAREAVTDQRLSGSESADNHGLGVEILNALDASTGYYNGLWATLDRDDVNRLIRLLRKAREQAFGKDE